MFKNFNYFLAPSIIQAFISFLILIPVTTFYLEPKDFGVVAIIMVIIAPIGPLASSGAEWILGSNYFIINEVDRKKLIFNTLLVDFSLKSLWVLLYWLSGSFILDFMIAEYDTSYKQLFEIALIGVLAGMFWPTVNALLIIQKKAKLYFALEIIRNLISLVSVLIFLIVLELGVISLFLGPLIVNTISFFFEIIFLTKNIKIEISRKWIEEVIKTGLPAIPSNLAETIGNISDRYFIQYFLSLSTLGIYSHAQSYSNIFKFIYKALTKTLMSDTIKSFTEKNIIKITETTKFIKICSTIFFSGGIILILISYDVVNLLTHGKFVESAPLIPIWYLIIFAYLYGAIYNFYLVSQKRIKILATSMTISSIFFIFITYLGVKYGGMYGGLTSIILSNFTVQLWRRILAFKEGCNIHIDRHFIKITSIYFLIYFYEFYFSIPFLFKYLLIFIFVFLAILKFRVLLNKFNLVNLDNLLKNKI